MRQRAMWLGSLGFGAGAAAAFLFDPALGDRRRRQLADMAAQLSRRISRAAAALGRDLSNRTQGVIASGQHRLHPAQPDDVVLEEHVHSVLGHMVRYPHEITVKVHEGCVTLDGPISSDARTRLASAVRRIAGVKDVTTRFDSHILPARESSFARSRRHSRG